MNVLYVYLAYPIDAVTQEQAVELGAMRDQVMRALDDHSNNLPPIALFEPAQAWTLSVKALATDPDQTLQAVNNAAVDRSDLVLAICPEWASTVGTPMEVQRAIDRGIPAFVVRDKSSWALQQPGVFQFRNLASALSALEGYIPRPRRAPMMKWTQVAEKVKADPEPRLAHHDDAGFDLTYCGEDDIVINPGQCENVPASIAVQFPPGVWGFVVGRSSTFRHRGLLVNPAVIDPGYRGELAAIVRNISGEVQRITRGQRLAQVVPLPALAPGFAVMQVDRLDDNTTRGANGFGSTGA